MSEERHQSRQSGSSFSGSGVLASGVASMAAAVVTSRFGVAGTLIGVALTAMIVNGISTIMKSYLQNLSGHVQKVPQKLRVGRNRRRAGRFEGHQTGHAQTMQADPVETRAGQEGMTVYGRPEKRGRLQAALEWFSGLPSGRKVSILLGATIPAVLAIVIALVGITGAEFAIGKPISCVTTGGCQTSSTTATGGYTTTSSPNTSVGWLASQVEGNYSSSSQQPLDPNAAGSQTPSGSGVPSGTPSGGVGQPSGTPSGGAVPGSGTPSGTPSGSGASPSGTPGVPSQ